MASLYYFFAGIFGHVWRAIFFRHDGEGLPGKLSAPLFVLLTLALVFSFAKHGLYGTFPLVLSVIKFSLVFFVLFAIFSTARFHLLAFYCCVSIGINSIAIMAMPFGVRKDSGFFFLGLSIWETTAFVVGILRITKRLDKGKD